MTDPTIAYWGPPLLPEEVELVEEHLASGKTPLAETAVVYVLLLADGSTYTGITNDVARRLAEHTRSARRTHANQYAAIEVTGAPNETYLAVHGEPTLAAVVATPTRRHALLYEALLTDKIAEAGVHVFGAGWDQDTPRWERNEFKGEKVSEPEALAAVVSA